MTNYVKFLSHHITEDVKTDTKNTKTDKKSGRPKRLTSRQTNNRVHQGRHLTMNARVDTFQLPLSNLMTEFINTDTKDT